MKQNMYSSAVFAGGLTSLHSNVTSSHSWHQKMRDTGLPDGEDRIHLCSLIFTQYRSVTDGQTDRQTDGFAVAYTALVTQYNLVT